VPGEPAAAHNGHRRHRPGGGGPGRRRPGQGFDFQEVVQLAFSDPTANARQPEEPACQLDLSPLPEEARHLKFQTDQEQTTFMNGVWANGDYARQSLVHFVGQLLKQKVAHAQMTPVTGVGGNVVLVDVHQQQ